MATTPKKVMIGNNTYYKTGMSVTLIKADAEGQCESRPVRDIWIKGNTFIDYTYNRGSGYAVIAIHSSSKIVGVSHPAHQNIYIGNNTSRTFGCPVLYVESTAGLLFRNDTITRIRTLPATSGSPYTFYLNGCKDTVIEDTVFEGEVLGRNIKTEDMKRNHLKTTLK